MRNLFIKPIALLYIIVLIGSYSCKKDLSTIPDNPATPSDSLPIVTIPNNPITLSVVGKVTDENNNAVSGAAVTGGGIIVHTDINGIFRINNGNFNGSFGTIKIEKSNYFTLVKTFGSTSGGTQYLKAKLSPRSFIGKMGVNGGILTLNSGNVIISFPNSAFVNSSGTAITDSVNVYGTYLDPTATDLNVRMPGNLSGVIAPSSLQILQSYGMVGIELKDAANQPVSLAPQKKVTITTTIPSSLLASAPSSILLWYFDESKGVWVNQGTAVKTGNTYKGDVSHFTFWNYDSNAALTFYYARFKNIADNSDLPYANISFEPVNWPNPYELFDITDGSGYTYGLMPANTLMRLRFYHPNGTVLLDSIIGPYSGGSNNGGTIYITFPSPPSIKGKVLGCSGQNITWGRVTATLDSLDYHSTLDANGNFSIPLPVIPAVNTPIYITGIDSATGTPVTPRSITYTGTSSLNTGFSYACANPPAQFISYTIDGGANHFFVRNADSAFCTTTFAFNRTDIACRRANGSPSVEGYVIFITGPTTVGGTDTSSILTLQQYTIASTPPTLHMVSFTENYSAYPAAQGIFGWVIGNFTCVFKDDLNISHIVRSNFKMWRGN